MPKRVKPKVIRGIKTLLDGYRLRSGYMLVKRKKVKRKKK
ncbi:MAG: hypothetical protein DDT23_01362 [candidate division WS2 bacterium]|nr:hypothetical protein [Candidatus Lithacetigena glycinireducens]